MRDEEYSWEEVLHSARHYWAVRHHGCGDTMSGVRMLDVSRAYGVLSVADKRALFLGVWLEQAEVPTGVIAKMRRYLNEPT